MGYPRPKHVDIVCSICGKTENIVKDKRRIHCNSCQRLTQYQRLKLKQEKKEKGTKERKEGDKK